MVVEDVEKLIEGMVVAIEPTINLGTHRTNHLSDGWTILTKDGKPSAHFEHDVAIVDGKPELLSTFKYIDEALGLFMMMNTSFVRFPCLFNLGCHTFQSYT